MIVSKRLRFALITQYVLTRGNLTSFNFCFDGIEKGCTVAVSTIGVKKEKAHFMLGYDEMLNRIKPSKIICYGKAFDEMNGDIIEVDYAKTNNLSKGYIKKIFGYISNKGGGSADGQSSGNPEPKETWVPKDEESKRFFGKPGEIKRTFIPTKKGGYWVDTKIGKDGKATKERQYTDHGNSKNHSNPHDNTIEWDKNGKPLWGDETNYFDEDAPEFKYFKITGVKKMNNDYNRDYKSKEEFYASVSRYSEIVFEWKNISYEICSLDGKRWWFINVTKGTEIIVDKIDDIMNCKIGNEKLIDICTKFTVIERTF